MAVVQKLGAVYDGMRNFLAGFGDPAKDKSASQRFVLELLDVEQLQAAYRSDWLCRKIIDVPAFDSCRAWREWKAEPDQIEKIEECEKNLGIQRKLMQATSKARLFGGAALIIGVDGQKFEDELDVEAVSEGDLAFVHVVSRWEIETGDLVRDLTSPWYGEPSYYKRVNTMSIAQEEVNPPLELSGLGYKPGDTLLIHPSRVVRLLGLEYPDLSYSQDSWGDSCLQPVVDAIKMSGLVNSSIASMIAEAKLDVIKVPGLLEMLATTVGTQKLRDRFSFAMAAKSTVNATLIDANEEWERIALTFSNMDAVMGMYMNVAAGAADIPATRLLGRSPDGMNATGDSDIRNYYDRLQADQAIRVQPALARLDEVLIRHALGDRPEEIYYEWKPLWQMDADQKSQVWLRKAQTYKIDVDSGLINPDVLREVRVNQCTEDGFYPGLDQAVEEFDIKPDEDEHDMLELEMKKQGLINMSQPQPGQPGQPPSKPNGGQPTFPPKAMNGKMAKPPVG